MRAWDEASVGFEKYLAAYFVARSHSATSEQFAWYRTALRLALQVDDPAARSALPSIYANLARCYDAEGQPEEAEKTRKLASACASEPADDGPFYHGTRAQLIVGDLLAPGGVSNYKEDLTMNHIYFTSLINVAGLAASLAKGSKPERVYVVEPTGVFENDPNVTDKKFPGNPTRSYRSLAPLRVVLELDEWQRRPSEQIQQWRERLARNTGEIIN